MSSKTISITIPAQLEKLLQEEADKRGISRSRYIGNLLLAWQSDFEKPLNDCAFQNAGWCNNQENDMACKAPQHEAETCALYRSSKETV